MKAKDSARTERNDSKFTTGIPNFSYIRIL
jgi:hypothetical protein